MGNLTVRELALNELSDWDQVVSGFAGWRVFHTRSWVEYLQTFTKGKAIFLFFEKDGAVVGAVPGIIIKFPLFRAFMSPMEGWQTQSLGPVFDREKTSDNEIIDTLVRFLVDFLGVQYIEIASTHLDSAVMKKTGFQGEAIYTQRAPLCPGNSDETFASINSKTRNQIRKALKLNLVLKFDADEQFVENFYDQLHLVFTRGGNTMPFSKERIKHLIGHLSRGANLLTISVHLPGGQECIATGIFLLGGDELYLWGWAHRREYGSMCPIELLTWTAMKRASEIGCRIFDLAGGGSAKKKYGGVSDETTYRWIWSKNPFLPLLREKARKMYRWQQSVRGGFKKKFWKFN